MSGVLSLVREDLREFAGYASARREGGEGRVWLNANESPWPNAADPGLDLHRYPDPQPDALRERLAALYGVAPERVLIGRGSDEAIDLLVRLLCRPGRDAVLVTPPVFGMYAVSARLQGAALVEVPLRDRGAGFALESDAVAEAAVSRKARLVFLCSPGNPTGQSLARDEVLALARRLAGYSLVVLDEAYVEYADSPSLADALVGQSNLAILRTLSKAHGLAAARIGCLLADPALVALLRNCQAPYPLPSPSVQLALSALSEAALSRTRERVASVRAERERLYRELAALPEVRRVYPSQGNFLLVRFADAGEALRRLRAAAVVVRDMRATPGLGDALRISIGRPEENDLVLAALRVGRPA
ncbi:histidinol-phosphate transaminase [Arenimonas fontis]|uniref:Histidinol-phosphate aminotransferase n=1 Tax=Arenimonas fontis TaxID=2608255 RepID=A0A5B2ZB75_9GAMM|nr:histidinol-phosphate transaminase [Arenimonas fontis]KAA2284520.1 histidinol-phosphate transaminase [Arenimonas fontis]